MQISILKTISTAFKRDEEINYYGYIPNLGASIFLIIVFSVILICHIIQFIRTRQKRFGVAICFCLILELAAYCGRAASHSNPTNLNLYIYQSICASIAPAGLNAAYFYLLSQNISIFGSKWIIFEIKPDKCFRYLVSLNIIGASLQGAGSGVISGSTSLSMYNLGVKLMEAGIGIQLVALVAFLFLWLNLFYTVYFYTDKLINAPKKQHYWDLSFKDHLFTPEYSSIRFRWQFRVMVRCISIGIIFIIGRCIFRMIEITKGQSVTLHQVYFTIFDSLFVALASAVLIWPGHPGDAFGNCHVKVFAGKNKNISP